MEQHEFNVSADARKDALLYFLDTYLEKHLVFLLLRKYYKISYLKIGNKNHVFIFSRHSRQIYLTQVAQFWCLIKSWCSCVFFQQKFLLSMLQIFTQMFYNVYTSLGVVNFVRNPFHYLYRIHYSKSLPTLLVTPFVFSLR